MKVTADSSNVWTVPLGLGVSKVVKFGKLPAKIGIAGQLHAHLAGRLRTAVERSGVFHPRDPEALQGDRLW